MTDNNAGAVVDVVDAAEPTDAAGVNDADGANGGWEFVDGRRLLPEPVVSAIGYRSALEHPALHRGLPSPSLTLVVTLDEPVVAGTTPEQAFGPEATSTPLVFGGLHTHPVYLAQPRVQTGLQLAVRPLALRRLSGMPASELSEQSIDAQDLWGPDIERLREQLCELPTWEQRFAALNTYLQERLSASANQATPRADVTEAWKWIAWHRGNGAITDLARHVHLSERQLTTVFKAELGLSPKTVSRLMRFEHARQRIAHGLRRGQPLDLAGIAHACGYCDHSHLVRDFHGYTGSSPSGWIAEEFRNIQAGPFAHGEEFPA